MIASHLDKLRVVSLAVVIVLLSHVLAARGQVGHSEEPGADNANRNATDVESAAPQAAVNPPQRFNLSELPDFRDPIKVAWFKFDDAIPNALIFALSQAVVALFLILLLMPIERNAEAALAAMFHVSAVVIGLLMTATGWFAEPNATALLIMAGLSLVHVTIEFLRTKRIVHPWTSAIAWGFFQGMWLAAPLGRVVGSPPDNRFDEEVRPFAVGMGLGLTLLAILALLVRRWLTKSRRAGWARTVAVLATAVVAGVFAIVPAVRTLGEMSPAHLESVFLSLHNTFYRAFSLEDEAGVRALMEKSLTGELFQQHFENMAETLRDPDSHRLVMQRLIPCTIRIEEAGKDSFVADYSWVVVGETHSHGPRGQEGPPRRKTYKYRADYHATRTTDGWRLSSEAYTLVEEHASPPEAPWWMRLFNEPQEIEFPPHRHLASMGPSLGADATSLNE